jgi:hypothetical protein
MRSPLSAILCLLSLLAVCLAPVPVLAQSDGDSIASAIVSKAKAGENPVALQFLGNKVCVWPEASYPDGTVGKLFSGHKFDPEALRPSEGVWFIGFVQPERGDMVGIFEIRQSTLRWQPSEDIIVTDLITCPAKIKVELNADIPTVTQFLPE